MWNAPNPEQFYRQVWDIVRQIPAGKVSTYGQIASMIPPAPDADPDSHRRLSPRWVGRALRSETSDGLPWHRVINSQGTISLPAGSTDALTQRRRLIAEGVQFSASGRVDFDLYGWDGPDEEWLMMQGLRTPAALGQKRLF